MPKSSFTFTDLDNMLSPNKDWSYLDSSEKISLVNKAQQAIGKLRNSNGLRTYEFDTISDGQNVMSGMVGTISSFNTAYLFLKFADYTGSANIISEVDDTNLLFEIDTESIPTIDTSSGMAIYTITLAGNAIDGYTKIYPSVPGICDIMKVNSTQFKVYAPLNHQEFGIEVFKVKET